MDRTESPFTDDDHEAEARKREQHKSALILDESERHESSTGLGSVSEIQHEFRRVFMLRKSQETCGSHLIFQELRSEAVVKGAAAEVRV